METLHRLYSLSALSIPSSDSEIHKMKQELSKMQMFVKVVQNVDTSDTEPLRSVIENIRSLESCQDSSSLESSDAGLETNTSGGEGFLRKPEQNDRELDGQDLLKYAKVVKDEFYVATNVQK
ncbi:hypothetical protein BKA69DRAFT_1042645 [Paraphysoderma sedebokerense]|nr:hypothetical protein BKA69DRAFT_1042645 [Paraphysoderma sedebokerense]